MTDFTKRSVGDHITLSANELNAMLEAAVANKQRPTGTAPTIQSHKQPQISVINRTSTRFDAFRAYKLKEPAILPTNTSNIIEFRKKIVFDVVVPDTSTAGRWCVLQEPANQNQIVPAVVYGVTQCWIDLLAVGDTHVESNTANTIHPRSAKTGSARILWVAGGVGTATATSQQWALIMLDQGSSPSFKVKCVDDYSRAQNYVSVKRVNASNVVEGDPFDVDIIYHTETNATFYCIVSNSPKGFLQIGRPPARGVGMFFGSLDGTDNPQSQDYMYPVAHVAP